MAPSSGGAGSWRRRGYVTAAALLLACRGVAGDVCQIEMRTELEGKIKGVVSGDPPAAVPCAWHIKPGVWLQSITFRATEAELHSTDRLSLYASGLPSAASLVVRFTALNPMPIEFELTHSDEVLLVLSASTNATSFNLDYECKPVGHRIGSYYFTPLVYVALMSILVLIGLTGLLTPAFLVCYLRARWDQERALQGSRLILRSELRRQVQQVQQHEHAHALSITMERRTCHALQGLPVASWHADECNGEEECCLCLDMFEEMDELRVLPCRHAFHKACIDAWFAARRYLPRSCPLCKRNPLDDSRPGSTGRRSSRSSSRNSTLGSEIPSVSLYGNSRVVLEPLESLQASAQVAPLGSPRSWAASVSTFQGDATTTAHDSHWRDPGGDPQGPPGYVHGTE